MSNNRKSKIVAKIADNRSEVEFLKSLFDAGADVAWLNTAHQDEEATLGVINRIRSISTTMPIWVDTKGPEVRTKNVDVPFEVKPGDYVTYTGDLTQKGTNIINVDYSNFHNEIPVGEVILYDDASIETIVEEQTPQGIKCLVKNAGMIKNKKSLNVPNVHMKLPVLSEKDKGFIHFCAKNEVDFIIHSFVQSKEDLQEIKDILKAYPEYKGKIISKIENREGFNNIREILEHSEGIMVARGDLGAEVPLEELPYMQKKMIEAALVAGKYCVVATQVLDSMIKNPRPTRAEVTDTANAILDGSMAVSMSGETAYGSYPLEATKTMARIMAYTEDKKNELVHFSTTPVSTAPEYKKAQEIIQKAIEAKAQKIVVSSKNISLAQALSAYRPPVVVVPLCESEWDVRQLAINYALRPIVASTPDKAATEDETLVWVDEAGTISVGQLKDLR